MSADLHYDLVVLVRRLVPGHHHVRTGHVLQLVYLFFLRKKNTTIKRFRRHLKAKPGFIFLAMVRLRTPPRFLLTVLPPFPMTLPAAKEGTLMWASSFTSSLGPKKFSSFSLPKMRHWACSRTWWRPDYSGCIPGTSRLFLPRREANWPVKTS